MSKTYLSVFYFDDNHFGIEVKAGLAPLEFDFALDLIHTFPDVKFSRKEGDVYKIPIHFKNVEIFNKLRSEHADKLELSDDALVVIRHGELNAQRLSQKADKKLMFQYSDELPEIKDFTFTQPTPFKHQHTGLWSCIGEEYAALFMEQGTGKTRIGVDEIRYESDLARKEGRRSSLNLIIAPRNVRYVWLGDEIGNHGQLGQWLPPDFEYYATRLRTGSRGYRTLIEGMKHPCRTKIFVINYDSVESMLEALMTITWDEIILDESHKIKGRNTARSKAVLQLRERARKRRIYTGTPVVNSITDLWMQCEFLEHGCLGFANFEQFKNAFANFRSLPKDRQAAEWTQLEALKKALARFAYVVKKSECLDLPPLTQQTIFYTLTAKQLEMYKDMEETYLAEIAKAEAEKEGNSLPTLPDEETEDFGVDLNSRKRSGAFTEAMTAVSRLVRFSQICSGFIKDPDMGEIDIPGGNPKLDALIELIEGAPPNSRIIIWTRFRYDRILIRKALDEMGLRYGTLDGSTGEKETAKLVNEFNSDPRGREPLLKALIADETVAGEGLTLVGSKNYPCYTAVYYSFDFSLGKRLQSEARLHRPGQEHPVTCYNLVGSGTVDEYVLERLEEKREISEEVKNFAELRNLLKKLQERREALLVGAGE